MILFPYKKLIVKTGMNSEEIFSALAEITFEQIWLHKNHKAFFWGSLDTTSNNFKLKLKDDNTIIPYIIKGEINEKIDSTNLIISIRWSILPMIIYSYFFIIAIIVIFALLGLVLFSFDPKAILIGLISLVSFFLFNNHLLKMHNIKEMQSLIINKIIKLTKGKIVFNNKA